VRPSATLAVPLALYVVLRAVVNEVLVEERVHPGGAVVVPVQLVSNPLLASGTLTAQREESENRSDTANIKVFNRMDMMHLSFIK
jgi:hypothetical protein